MDFLDLKSIKSIIHGFEMDLDLQIKTSWILDGFGFTKEIYEIHEIREFRSTILIIRNNDKFIIYTIYLMDFMDLISAFHMDLDWIWIYELVENGLWIIDWIWIMISIHPVPLNVIYQQRKLLEFTYVCYIQVNNSI